MRRGPRVLFPPGGVALRSGLRSGVAIPSESLGADNPAASDKPPRPERRRNLHCGLLCVQCGQCSAESRQLGASAELLTFRRTHNKEWSDTMSTLVSFVTVTTSLPTGDDERPRLLRQIGDRDQQLFDYGREGYRLANTVTVTSSQLVTVVDTLTKEVS